MRDSHHAQGRQERKCRRIDGGRHYCSDGLRSMLLEAYEADSDFMNTAGLAALIDSESARSSLFHVYLIVKAAGTRRFSSLSVGRTQRATPGDPPGLQARSQVGAERRQFIPHTPDPCAVPAASPFPEPAVQMSSMQRPGEIQKVDSRYR